MDYALFKSIFGEPMGQAEKNTTGLRVTSITGSEISIKDYVEVEVEIMGRLCTHPFILVEGLQNHALVIRCDIIKEDQLIIDGATNEVKFKDLHVLQENCG